MRTLIPTVCVARSARLVLAGIIVLITLTLAGCGTLGDSTTGAIAGFVTISASVAGRDVRGLSVGPPVDGEVALSNASVLLDSGSRIAYTDANGEFYIGGVAPGSHTLTITHPDAWAPVTFAIDVLAGQTVEARHRLGRGYYVFVGIDNYQSPQVPDLTGPENDVRAIEGVMGGVNAGNVTVLTGAGASKSVIEQAIADDAARMSEEDYMVFYFSGHGDSGLPYSSALGGKDFICPWDTALDVSSSVITDGELASWLEAIPGQNATVILDSCHSGSFADGVETRGIASTAGRTLPLKATSQSFPVMRSLSLHGNFVLLAAAQADQDAIEVGGHGLFTTALVEALGVNRAAADVNHDRVISTKEFYDYACARLKQESASTTQVPFMWPNRPGFEGPAVARY